MKILSIDVGMKNLAYCLFFINEKTYFEIDSWDVINICQTELPKKCCFLTKECTREPKYFKEDKFYCKIHARYSHYHIPNIKNTLPNIKKRKLVDIKKYCKDNSIDSQNCKLKDDYIKIIEEYLNTQFLDIIVPIRADNINLVVLGRNIQHIFDDLFNKHNIDCVIIENQISPLANRMKTLQGMIAQYFIMNNTPCIEFISASNKLKEFINKQKLSYREKKKLGVSTTKALFQKYQKFAMWEDMFNSHKKKDDLADCFLQGYWYIKNSQLFIPT